MLGSCLLIVSGWFVLAWPTSALLNLDWKRGSVARALVAIGWVGIPAFLIMSNVWSAKIADAPDREYLQNLLGGSIGILYLYVCVQLGTQVAQLKDKTNPVGEAIRAFFWPLFLRARVDL